MNEESNFESLRRMLVLKRHEIPPPGYFHRLSGNVIARIRAGETAETSAWFSISKLLETFEFKPAFAASLAGALCLLLVFGIVYAEKSDFAAPQPLLTQMTDSVGQLASVSQPQTSSSFTPILAANNNLPNLQNSQSVASLFGAQQNPFAQQVGFTIPGN